MKKTLPIILIFLALSLTGCLGMEITELTDEEHDLVVQAVAYRILQSDNLYTEKLATPTPTPTVTVTPTPSATPSPTALPSPTESPEDPSDNPEATPTPAKDENKIALAELSEVIGIEGISLEYGGYELYDSYTYNSYCIEAEAGKKLMIVKLIVKNDLETTASVKLNAKNFNYRLDVNTGTELEPDLTWLLNDFTTLDVKIGAGNRFESVLVFNVEQNFEPETMNLFITKDSKTVIVKLK